MKTFRIIEFEELDSTSKYMKENLDRLSAFDVVTANIQTNAYGRMQRQWYDSVDNLSFSLLLKLPVSEKNGLFAQISALAVTDVLKDYHQNVSIKWPNDCLIESKKIAGILIESVVKGNNVRMIVGVGININNPKFDSTIEDKATSLYLETDKRFDKKEVMGKFLENFKKYLDMFLCDDYSFLELAKKRSSIIGKTVWLFEDEEVLVKDIDDYGRLIIERNGKEEVYSGSEISLERIY